MRGAPRTRRPKGVENGARRQPWRSEHRVEVGLSRVFYRRGILTQGADLGRPLVAVKRRESLAEAGWIDAAVIGAQEVFIGCVAALAEVQRVA